MQSLASRLARGDESAFTELYDACADRLHGYAASRLGSRDAADVVQTVFLRAVKSRRRFRRVDNPSAYLFQMARNEITRAAARRQRCSETTLAAEVLATSDGVDAADREALATGLARLSQPDRELVELKIYGSLTFREIAVITGQPHGTVATRYRRALDSLRGWLSNEFSNR